MLHEHQVQVLNRGAGCAFAKIVENRGQQDVEARHGGAYLRYMKKYLAQIGVLMALARRTEKPLHPTNLHINKALFPNDTVQSRLPDPDWLELAGQTDPL